MCPSHGKQKRNHYFTAGGEECQLRRCEENLSFQRQYVPGGDNVFNIEALEQMSEGEGYPSYGEVVWRRPNFNDRI